jgi:hypothetical protein
VQLSNRYASGSKPACPGAGKIPHLIPRDNALRIISRSMDSQPITPAVLLASIVCSSHDGLPRVTKTFAVKGYKGLPGGTANGLRALLISFHRGPNHGFPLRRVWNLARKAATGNCPKRRPKPSYSEFRRESPLAIRCRPHALPGCVPCIDTPQIDKVSVLSLAPAGLNSSLV